MTVNYTIWSRGSQNGITKVYQCRNENHQFMIKEQLQIWKNSWIDFVSNKIIPWEAVDYITWEIRND